MLLESAPAASTYSEYMLPSAPHEYSDYLVSHGNFEGFTVERSRPGYVALWSPNGIEVNNADVEIEVYAPEFLAFGGDGGGELLAFDHAGAVFMLPMIAWHRIAPSESQIAFRT